jgi:hypothetical protein
MNQVQVSRMLGFRQGWMAREGFRTLKPPLLLASRGDVTTPSALLTFSRVAILKKSMIIGQAVETSTFHNFSEF